MNEQAKPTNNHRSSARGGQILPGLPGEVAKVGVMALGRVQLSVTDGRDLAEGALRGIGFDHDEARIVTNHVIDAALCGEARIFIAASGIPLTALN